jgi:hypothetical protein
MAFRTFLGPLEPEREYDIATGVAPDPVGRDLDFELEREDRLREMGPSQELEVNALLYGARSGTVTLLGPDDAPIREAA